MLIFAMLRLVQSVQRTILPRAHLLVLRAGAKVRSSELRQGHVIMHNNKLCSILSIDRSTNAQRAAYMQTEMRDLRSGLKYKERFRSEETVDRVQLSQEKYTFLYHNGANAVFMHDTTYEQVEIPHELVGEQKDFLEEQTPVQVQFYEEQPVSVALPDKVTVTIKETASPSNSGAGSGEEKYKPATLTNGLEVMVPHYCAVGEKVVFNSQKRTFLERQKS